MTKTANLVELDVDVLDLHRQSALVLLQFGQIALRLLRRRLQLDDTRLQLASTHAHAHARNAPA